MNKPMTWPATALKCFIVLFFVACMAWLNRVNVSVLDTRNGDTSSTFGVMRQDEQEAAANVAAPRSSISGDVLRDAVAVQEDHKSVMRQEHRCIIRQAVYNSGVKAIRKIALSFAFRDAAGNSVGSQQIAGAEMPVGAGESREVTFSLPCPESVADARISIPPSVEENGRNRKIVLLATDATYRAIPISEPEDISYKLVVALPDLSICPSPEPCQLPVDIEGGHTTKFKFQRSLNDLTQLTSDDPILAAHLKQRRSAILRAPSPSGATTVVLSDRDLVAIEKSNSIFNWLSRVFQR